MQRIKRQRRVLLTALFCSFIAGLFFLKLVYIQFFKSGDLVDGAVRQRAQSVILNYNRGDILDRNGISLLGGKEEKVLAVFPALLDRSRGRFFRVCPLTRKNRPRDDEGWIARKKNEIANAMAFKIST